MVAAAVAVSCVALGLWQLRRLDERRALNARIERSGDEPPRSIDSSSAAAAATAYERVRVAGTYDAEHEVLLYGRSLDGRPGHHVVTPLILRDGSAVLVVRGWVPFPMQRPPVPQASPAATEVVVDGLLVPDRGDGSDVPDARGIVGTLDVRGIASTVPYEVFPLGVQLLAQHPPQPSLPRPVPRPAPSEGPHLSYAIQWFSFAAVALVGGAILIRRERAPV